MSAISIGDAARDLKQRIARPTDVWGWEQLVAEKDAEIERLRAALELIAGSSSDKLQAMQARCALDNIGPSNPEQSIDKETGA